MYPTSSPLPQFLLQYEGLVVTVATVVMILAVIIYWLVQKEKHQGCGKKAISILCLIAMSFSTSIVACFCYNKWCCRHAVQPCDNGQKQMVTTYQDKQVGDNANTEASALPQRDSLDSEQLEIKEFAAFGK